MIRAGEARDILRHERDDDEECLWMSFSFTASDDYKVAQCQCLPDQCLQCRLPVMFSTQVAIAVDQEVLTGVEC